MVSLSAQLSAVDQCVSDLEGLSVPDAMGDIHSSYVNGAKELQTALSSYVQLYEDVKAPANGVAPSGADYDSRMAEIQIPLRCGHQSPAGCGQQGRIRLAECGIAM